MYPAGESLDPTILEETPNDNEASVGNVPEPELEMNNEYFHPYEEREWSDNFAIGIEEKRVWKLQTQPTDDLRCQDGVMLDSGASACVCGMECPQRRVPGKIVLVPGRRMFRFGDGEEFPAWVLYEYQLGFNRIPMRRRFK